MSGREVSVRSERSKFSVRGLNFWYGHKQALFDISVDIKEHSVLALIGPSGCGKSTFLRCLHRKDIYRHFP